MLSQPRGQLAQKSVPQLTQGLFASIREGFIGDTVRKFNYKLLLQMQDGLSEYLQKCLDQEDITALCSTEEVHSCPQSKTCRSFAITAVHSCRSRFLSHDSRGSVSSM